MALSKDLTAASAAPLVLSLLSRGDSYGYELIRAVRELSRDRIEWTEGMLYPVLHRMEEQELVESYWAVAESGRKRKYYRITKAGIAALRAQREEWVAVYAALSRAWRSANA